MRQSKPRAGWPTRCERSGHSAFRDTVCHGDLHLGNVAWVGDGPVLFDWTDACFGHPYLDAVLLARSAGIAGADDQSVRESFLREWRLRFPDVDHDRVWELAGWSNASSR